MDNRPASEYAQSGSNHPPSVSETPSEPPSSSLADQTSTAAPAQYNHPPQPEVKYEPQSEVRSANISSANTPQSDYGLNPPHPTRSPAYQDYLPRPPSYAPNSHPGGAPAGMAQATSPFLAPPTSSPPLKSDGAVPIDPSLPANSPSYPPPYSPYQPQGHDMSQYQGHPPPPPHQMYARPEWPQSYGQSHHMPGPYASPATTVGSASPAASAGSRPGTVCF